MSAGVSAHFTDAAALREAVCPTTRKYGFRSRKTARRYAASRRGTGNFNVIGFYHCRHCGWWHMTSQKRTP